MQALFPLSQPLFPDSLLSLRIFEARYLSLIDRCVREQLPFGVVTLLQGAEVMTGNGVKEVFSDVGCLAYVTDVRTIQPGLLAVQCTGAERFHLKSAERDVLGLWHADFRTLEADIATDIPPDLQALADRLGALIADAQRQGIENRLPMSRPYRLDECGWVANQWSYLLNMSVEKKLQLLEEDDPLTRLTMMKLLLDRTDAL